MSAWTASIAFATAARSDGQTDMDELTAELTDLYNEHYSQLLRMAVLLVDDRSAAEDIVQDAFVRVFDSRARLRDRDRALAFLRRSVLNKSRSLLRRRQVSRKYQHRLVQRESGPDESAHGVDRTVLAEAIARLPPRQREAIVLRYYADFSEAYTAKIMKVTPGAVKAYCSRGVTRLSSLLRERV
ncbi:RNA polymerase subunit sigma-24 [Actinopolyspora erythraea]|uniref:RNA polymerase subunit sigma-24 n=2 Tax=Actinopolyspora erythraea TaxID=414996 RepID=A0ABR4WZC8_9ACTN|nr:RNA polymerase subunit sigma-24 [Actinopolyspora erythraea]